MSFFVTKVVDEWGTSYALTGAGYGALIAFILVLLLAACYISGGTKRISTKQLVFSSAAFISKRSNPCIRTESQTRPQQMPQSGFCLPSIQSCAKNK